jgi:capsid assembly protease
MKNPIELIARSPLWAIRPEATITAMLALLNATTWAESGWEAARPYTQGQGKAKLAVVPIQGVLTKDGPAWLGSNYDTISRAVEDGASDTEVKKIVLTVDSPGGDVLGCPECASVIQAAAKVKPVLAIVEGQAASAAYWLTSQANAITLTPSGEVGSVGVRMMHADVSKMLDNQGVKITELTSGLYKGEWSPYAPLSQDAKENMQARMDSVHGDFLNAVSSARGERASQDIKDQRFGEGRMFSATEAIGHGLVDAVLSTRDFFKTLLPAVEQELSAPAFPIRAALHAHLEHVKQRDKV